MMQRLAPDALGMMLHWPLFRRMVDFGREHNPDIPAEPIVGVWLARFYAGSPDVYVLVDLDETKGITAHVYAEVQEMYGVRAMHVYQIWQDKADLSKLDETIEWLEKTAYAQGCTLGTAMIHPRHTRAFQKRYGYASTRTVISKALGPAPAEDTAHG